MMDRIIRFIKNWTLPIAMIVGAGVYMLFAKAEFMTPLKPMANSAVEVLMPTLIFIQLLLSFCKANPKELIPNKWHMILAIFQSVSCTIIALLLIWDIFSWEINIVLQGAMICLICPTATAAVVITSKLGGNAAQLVTYTMIINIVAAIIIPLLFPLVEPHEGLSFLPAFSKILSKVFPLLIIPFILAMVLRKYFKRVHAQLLKYSGYSFYIWAIALAIVTSQTIRWIANSDADAIIKISVAFAGLVTCFIQFAFGRYVGSKYNSQISAGQAIGQKNTVLAIWLACTYLNPLSSVAPGSYVLWQNIFNSWQLYRKRSC